MLNFCKEKEYAQFYKYTNKNQQIPINLIILQATVMIIHLKTKKKLKMYSNYKFI